MNNINRIRELCHDALDGKIPNEEALIRISEIIYCMNEEA